jgi:hypothetical protein
MRPRRRIASAKVQDYADYCSQRIRLQQGFATGEMGLKTSIAEQQVSNAHLRFGS